MIQLFGILEAIVPLSSCSSPDDYLYIYIYYFLKDDYLLYIYIYIYIYYFLKDDYLYIYIYIYCFNSIKCNETYNRSYGGNITATKEHLGTMTTTDTPSFVIQLNSSFTSIIYHFIVVGIHIYIRLSW